MARYSREIVKQIVEAIEIGMYAQDACALVGISKDTYYRWLKEKSDFSDAIHRAEARSIQKALMVIQSSLTDANPESAFRFLARRFPERYGEKAVSKVEHSGNVTSRVEFVDALAAITEITTRSGSDA